MVASLQLPDDDQVLIQNVDKGHGMSIKGHGISTQNVTQTPSEVVDVDVDSERLQNRYMSKPSHTYFKALQMTCTLEGS